MYDCSGFVCSILGIPPTSTSGLAGPNMRLVNVPAAQKRDGDVVIFKNPGKQAHAGFYDASNGGSVVSAIHGGVMDQTLQYLRPRNGDPTAYKRLQELVNCSN